MTKLTGLGALFGAVAVLAATNPNEDQFIHWTTARVLDQLAKEPAPATPWAAAARTIDLAALPAMIQQRADREDCALFSVYRGKGDWEGVVVLGIAGHFIPIATGSPP
jgi:hypothetical protein